MIDCIIIKHNTSTYSNAAKWRHLELARSENSTTQPPKVAQVRVLLALTNDLAERPLEEVLSGSLILVPGGWCAQHGTANWTEI